MQEFEGLTCREYGRGYCASAILACKFCVGPLAPPDLESHAVQEER
jgi:hypothetical protein